MSTHNANRFDSEHDAPEESVHLLRAELDACREEIDRLRQHFAEVCAFSARVVEAQALSTKSLSQGRRSVLDGLVENLRVAAMRGTYPTETYRYRFGDELSRLRAMRGTP